MIHADQANAAALLAGLYVLAQVLKGETVSVVDAAAYAAHQLRALDNHLGRPLRIARAVSTRKAKLQAELAALDAPHPTLKGARRQVRAAKKP